VSVFLDLLNQFKSSHNGRQWIFVPYDQLTDSIGPLSVEDPRTLGILMIENPWKAQRRPYHKQKLALIISNMRHFAIEQAERGVAVKYVVAGGPYRDAIEPLVKETGPVYVMTPAEWELRHDLEPLVKSGLIRMIEHEGWLTDSSLLHRVEKPGPSWRMDAFYREARKTSGILMSKGKPLGGKYSHDIANRLPWRGLPVAPEPPGFPMTPVKEEVGGLIAKNYAHHPGRLNLYNLPSTKSDAENLWVWAKDNCLEWFGPYEDAMSSISSGLFHTRISSLLNIHRLLPSRVVAEAAALDIPIQSKEGFIRQVLGWREFVRHAHTTTDGFRVIGDTVFPLTNFPGDGGYRTWAQKKWLVNWNEFEPPGGARPNWMKATGSLPMAYWGAKSGMACLDSVVNGVWREGYSHHITRLMILANIATLLDVNPRELTDWFWIAYTDAYDWVVEPNVLGMGTYAVGSLMTTKPYVSGANYINRMSNFCDSCRLDPSKTCPLTPMYWAFLERRKQDLLGNPRLSLVMKGLDRRPESIKEQDRAVFNFVRKRFDEGATIDPKDLQKNK
jgi:deoxyribodipyrimidine photolyase-related protein